MDKPRAPLRNSEGYMDLTAYEAISNIERERLSAQDDADARCSRLVRSIKTLIDLSGFDLVARIEIKDRKTGRLYR